MSKTRCFFWITTPRWTFARCWQSFRKLEHVQKVYLKDRFIWMSSFLSLRILRLELNCSTFYKVMLMLAYSSSVRISQELCTWTPCEVENVSARKPSVLVLVALHATLKVSLLWRMTESWLTLSLSICSASVRLSCV